jgi:hypothetical protein
VQINIKIRGSSSGLEPKHWIRIPSEVNNDSGDVNNGSGRDGMTVPAGCEGDRDHDRNQYSDVGTASLRVIHQQTTALDNPDTMDVLVGQYSSYAQTGLPLVTCCSSAFGLATAGWLR